MYARAELICEELLLLASEIGDDEITDRLFDISAEIMLIVKREGNRLEEE